MDDLVVLDDLHPLHRRRPLHRDAYLQREQLVDLVLVEADRRPHRHPVDVEVELDLGAGRGDGSPLPQCLPKGTERQLLRVDAGQGADGGLRRVAVAAADHTELEAAHERVLVEAAGEGAVGVLLRGAVVFLIAPA